jgi:MoxR-like ATPase
LKQNKGTLMENKIPNIALYEKIKSALTISNKIIVGKEKKVLLSFIAVLIRGHLLIEDTPGVGKTTLVKLLGKVFGLGLSRIQFTNDLLPSDILGAVVFNKDSNSFSFHKGPIFNDLILADELNRAPAKTQSALLQAMEEKQVSMDNETHTLSENFIVMAAQNPRSQIGTHTLPESQLDRFLMKISIGFPDKSDEIEIYKGEDRSKMIEELKPQITLDDLAKIRTEISNIHINDIVYDYLFSLIKESRIMNTCLSLSPRAGKDLIMAAKAYAWLNNRNYVDTEDVQYLFPFVAGHRLINPNQTNLELETNISCEIIEHVSIS